MASSPHRSVPLSWCHHDREFSTFAALHSTRCLRLGQLDAAWLLGPFTTVGSVLTVLAPALRSRTGKT